MANVMNTWNTFTRSLDIDVLSEELILHQKSEGDVNCVVWDAAIVLGKYLEELYKKNSNILKGLHILELGSGLGCVGLTAACLGANVLLTDQPEAIPLLQFNIDKNKSLCKGSITVATLEWGRNVDLFQTPDKILLADCVYYKESIDPLITTLKHYTSKNTEIILAQELRDSYRQTENWQYFLNSIKDCFRYTEVPLSEQNANYCSTDIIIMKLYRV